MAGLAAGCLLIAVPHLPLSAQAVAEVQVTPETMTLGAGQKQAIFAAAYDRRGNLIANAKFTFRSSDTTIARVLRDGTVVGVRPGLAKVEARVQSRRASMAVLITGGAEAATGAGQLSPGTVLTLAPAALALLPAETIRLVPQALKEDGSPVALGPVEWKSLQPEVAAVDSGGLVVGVAPGRTVIQATSSHGLMATAPVEVAQADFALAPDRIVLGADGTDTVRAVVPSQGRRAVQSGIQWRSMDSTVARVGPTGIVQGQAPGETEIVAGGFGQERRATVIVHKTPEALVVSPPQGDQVRIPRRGTRRFSAVAEAADSTPIPEVRIAWEVRDTGVATFDPAAGVLTAKALGSTTLTARVRGFEPVVWEIQTIPGLVGLDRARLGLAPGERATVAARLLDDAGNVTGEVSDLRWVSTRPEVATIGDDGTVEAARPGRTLVTATAPWGVSDTVEVFVVGDLLVTSSRAAAGGIAGGQRAANAGNRRTADAAGDGRTADTAGDRGTANATGGAHRRGAFGIYYARLAQPDSLIPLLVDGAANVDAVYSPDRTRIAFSSDRAGSYDLYVMDADGRSLTRVTADAGVEREPAWTPDGARLVYTGIPAGGGAPQLYSIGIDGTEPRALTGGPGGSQSPAVSPDGRTIAFVSTRDRDADLYLMDADNATRAAGEAGEGNREVAEGNLRRLTDNSQRESSPHFLPGGDLVYAVERGKGARIMRLSLGKRGDATVLTQTTQPVVALGLSRDGERVAYVTGKVAELAKGRGRLTLYVQPATPDSKPTGIMLLGPGEQIVRLAF